MRMRSDLEQKMKMAESQVRDKNDPLLEWLCTYVTQTTSSSTNIISLEPEVSVVFQPFALNEALHYPLRVQEFHPNLVRQTQQAVWSVFVFTNDYHVTQETAACTHAQQGRIKKEVLIPGALQVYRKSTLHVGQFVPCYAIPSTQQLNVTHTHVPIPFPVSEIAH